MWTRLYRSCRPNGRKKMKNKRTQKSILRKILHCTLSVSALLLVVFIIYFLYVLLTYKRLPDHMKLEVEEPLQKVGKKEEEDRLQKGKEYSAISYNIGFGAYTPEFSFFMDGGKSSVAESKESVIRTVEGAAKHTVKSNPDFALIQEVDIQGTRSYHVNEYNIFNTVLAEYYKVLAINYNSAFLFYPPYKPHGKNKSGIVTYSKYPFIASERRSLPISESLSKLLDLDRCYSISRIEVSDEKEFVIFHIHLSAYGNDKAVREGQVGMLLEDMEKEYAKGNYIICGGDFNHELKETEAKKEVEGDTPTWAHPFPKDKLSKHFYFGIDRLEEEKKEIFPTSRNANIPYSPQNSQLNTLDGFIFSDNIECTYYNTIESGFLYSDHEAVSVRFILK